MFRTRKNIEKHFEPNLLLRVLSFSWSQNEIEKTYFIIVHVFYQFQQQGYSANVFLSDFRNIWFGVEPCCTRLCDINLALFYSKF